jgi:hypothetical protein
VPSLRRRHDGRTVLDTRDGHGVTAWAAPSASCRSAWSPQRRHHDRPRHGAPAAAFPHQRHRPARTSTRVSVHRFSPAPGRTSDRFDTHPTRHPCCPDHPRLPSAPPPPAEAAQPAEPGARPIGAARSPTCATASMSIGSPMSSIGPLGARLARPRRRAPHPAPVMIQPLELAGRALPGRASRRKHGSGRRRLSLANPREHEIGHNVLHGQWDWLAIPTSTRATGTGTMCPADQ